MTWFGVTITLTRALPKFRDSIPKMVIKVKLLRGELDLILEKTVSNYATNIIRSLMI